MPEKPRKIIPTRNQRKQTFTAINMFYTSVVLTYFIALDQRVIVQEEKLVLDHDSNRRVQTVPTHFRIGTSNNDDLGHHPHQE
jgi:hypothetical protein